MVALGIAWGMSSAVMVNISGNELAGRRWQWSSMMCPLFASAVGDSRQTPGFRKICKGCFEETWAALQLDATAWLAEALRTTPSAS